LRAANFKEARRPEPERGVKARRRLLIDVGQLGAAERAQTLAGQTHEHRGFDGRVRSGIRQRAIEEILRLALQRMLARAEVAVLA
jgi:hypothetical protein